MKTIEIEIIVAVAEGGLIGNSSSNDIPWYLPRDLKHFKETTTGSVLISGSKTYNSFGKPLPNRTHIITSRNPNYVPINGNLDGKKDCYVCSSIEDAIDCAAEIAGERKIICAGGGQLYHQMLTDPRLKAMISKLHITYVEGKFEGDVFFPEIDYSEWKEVSSETFQPDEKNAYCFTIKTYAPA